MIPENLRITFQADARGRLSGFLAPIEALVDPIEFNRLPSKRLSDPAFLARLVGEYELPGQNVKVSLKGDLLVVQAAGQPSLELQPSGEEEFTIKGVTGISIRFEIGDEGPATSVTFIQPNGVFEAKRVEAE